MGPLRHYSSFFSARTVGSAFSCGFRQKFGQSSAIKIAAVACILLPVYSLYANENDSRERRKITTDLLFFPYDAGETAAMIPVLQRLEEEEKCGKAGKNFRVLPVGTARTLISKEMFPGKQLTLEDLGIEETIDTTTERTRAFSQEALQKIAEAIHPKSVLVGSASRVQEQMLSLFKNKKTFVFIDNFDYDPTQPSFETVKGVAAVAQNVLCPSRYTVELFQEKFDNRQFHVVGKPTLERWKQEISQVDKESVFQRAGLDPNGGPIILFIGGYGPGYEIINPLFSAMAVSLCKLGYQVLIQPHPKVEAQKVKTSEALAIVGKKGAVVGYNSSVILDAALIGIGKAIYMIPPGCSFTHFAIRKGYLPQVTSEEELLKQIQGESPPLDIAEAIGVPDNSIELITRLF